MPHSPHSAASAPSSAAVLPSGGRGTRQPSAAPCGTVVSHAAALDAGTPAATMDRWGGGVKARQFTT